MYKHIDFGFNFTVDTNLKIPEDLVSKFYNRMSSIDKDLIEYYSSLNLDIEHSFLLLCEDEPIEAISEQQVMSYFDKLLEQDEEHLIEFLKIGRASCRERV